LISLCLSVNCVRKENSNSCAIERSFVNEAVEILVLCVNVGAGNYLTGRIALFD
jgi:hypothetical protein